MYATDRMGPATRCLLILTLSVTYSLPRVAAEGPPEEMTVEQMFQDIEALEGLRLISPDARQTRAMVETVEEFHKVKKAVSERKNQPHLRRALWQVRTRLLEGEKREEEVWEPLEELWEMMEQQEETMERASERALAELRSLLTKEQIRRIALQDTPYGRIERAVRDLASFAVGDGGDWREWRSETASELTEIAHDQNPQAPKDLDDQLLMLFIQARKKGANYVKANQEKLYKEILALVMQPDKRGGPSLEEQHERVNEMMGYLLEEPRMLVLLKEKLELTGRAKAGDGKTKRTF